MSADCLYSLDRIEGEVAVLVEDGGAIVEVLVSELPPIPAEGKMYREIDGRFVEDASAEESRRATVRALQDRLRRRKK